MIYKILHTYLFWNRFQIRKFCFLRTKATARVLPFTTLHGVMHYKTLRKQKEYVCHI